MSAEKCVVCGGSGMKPDGPLTIRCWNCNPEPKRKHGPMCSCMSCSQAHVQGLVAEAKAEARREALWEAADIVACALDELTTKKLIARGGTISEKWFGALDQLRALAKDKP